MSESGKQSEEDEESSGLSGSSEEEEDDWDPSYDYTGEESGPEDDEEEAEFSEDEEEARRVVGRLGGDGEDWQYCEQGAVPRRLEPPQVKSLSTALDTVVILALALHGFSILLLGRPNLPASITAILATSICIFETFANACF